MKRWKLNSRGGELKRYGIRLLVKKNVGWLRHIRKVGFIG